MPIRSPRVFLPPCQVEPMRRAVVIGAGLGGLAAAVRLLAAGLDVTVLEAADTVGGRAGQIRQDGFTFDTGPSLITMPRLIDDLFTLAGERRERCLPLRSLDPFYRIDWADGRSFLFNGDRAHMVDQIGHFSLTDARNYDRFLEAGRRIYEEAILAAGTRSFLRAADFARLVPAMLRLGALRSVDGFVGRFFTEPHVRQAFGFHSLYIGGDPFRVPAVYAALAYLQIAEGVWYADGGVYALVRALAGLVARGGCIRTGEAARAILQQGGQVRGVRTDAGDLPADVVVSNADVLHTRALLGRRGRTPRLSMSCYLLYLGTDRPFPQLQHHTLLVGRDYRGFIEDVTRRRRTSDDMCLYVHAPARTEPAMAPPGGESLAVLLPVPHLTRTASDAVALRARVLDALEGPLHLEGLRSSIRVERSWTPLDFRDRLGAVAGNAFGPEPLLRQSAYFRQPNRDRSLRGMYYVGAGTHPGAGIPGVFLGAQVTTDLIVQDLAA